MWPLIIFDDDQWPFSLSKTFYTFCVENIAFCVDFMFRWVYSKNIKEHIERTRYMKTTTSKSLTVKFKKPNGQIIKETLKSKDQKTRWILMVKENGYTVLA